MVGAVVAFLLLCVDLCGCCFQMVGYVVMGVVVASGGRVVVVCHVGGM